MNIWVCFERKKERKKRAELVGIGFSWFGDWDG